METLMQDGPAAPAAPGAGQAPGGGNAKRPPKAVRQVVLRECGEVGRYRVRLVAASEKPDAAKFVDVREYVRGANYEGFTRKGVRLGPSETRALRAVLQELEGAF
jgi:hypothetical protein